MVGPLFEVDSSESLDAFMELCHEAQKKFATYNQAQVDKIFSSAALRATDSRVKLAKMTVEEGGMGILEDKTIKNHFAAEYVHNTYKNEKTCGVVERDECGGYVKMAEPIGVLAGVVPCTNPTATTIFKCLLALKTRNCIVFSPHPRTAKCTIEAARICRDAAVAAGAPANCIGWISVPTVPLCSELMNHKRTVMIVATGAGGLVKAAYSSGKPAMGGGAGNTPVIIDAKADIPMAVNSVILSKSFDNGMICASEQAVITVKSVAEIVKEEFKKRGAHIMNDEEKKKVGDFILTDKGTLNPAAVGQPAWKLAELAGATSVPKGTVLLVAPISVVGPSEKLSHEKLCPCIGFFVMDDFQQCVDRALSLVEYGGMGHTSVLYAEREDTEEKLEKIKKFSAAMPTGRTLIGMPTSQGAIGDLFNFRQMPSLSLGCGSWGMNASSEGLQVKHLLNYKIVTERREHVLWFKSPPGIYFNRGILQQALTDIKTSGLKKAFICTDADMVRLGYVKSLTDALERHGIGYSVFSQVTVDPTDLVVQQGVEAMKVYKPDHLVAFGGGSPMDAGKMMRMLYEHPELEIAELYTRFMDLRKRVVKFPRLGSKVKKVVCIPTTSGTGAEMTPFAVLTDHKLSIKYPIVDYRLTPDMAILDGDFVLTMPKSLAAFTGLDALTHAMESYVSMLATDYTKGFSMQAISMIFENLEKSVNSGDADAREAMHNASSIAGLGFANAFLGINHSMAHQLGGYFHIPHGLANALIMSQVVKFNAADAPTKMGTFPQYTFPRACQEYAEIADALNLTDGCKTNLEKVNKLVEAIEDLKARVKCPKTIMEYGKDNKISESEYMAKVDEMALAAFDDQCTGTNPRYPLVPELRTLFVDAFNGTIRDYSQSMAAGSAK